MGNSSPMRNMKQFMNGKRCRREIQSDHIGLYIYIYIYIETSVKESNGAEMSGLERPLATKINIPPLRPSEN